MTLEMQVRELYEKIDQFEKTISDLIKLIDGQKNKIAELENKVYSNDER